MTPWITWLLFAKSASACEELTVDCVIDNATADKAYTAGGLMAPIDTSDPTVIFNWALERLPQSEPLPIGSSPLFGTDDSVRPGLHRE